MVQPYTAVGLIPTVRGVRKRAEIERNLEHIAHMIAAASWLSSLDLPAPLVAVPEGALQGFIRVTGIPYSVLGNGDFPRFFRKRTDP